MRPTQAELLESVSRTIDEYIAPEVTSEMARSLLLTIRYLLHQTGCRVSSEAEGSWEQAVHLRATLERVAAFLAPTNGGADRGGRDPLAAEVAEALERTSRPPDEYPSLALLTEETTELRRILDVVIRELDSRARRGTERDRYDRIRSDIRDCLRHQLETEERWMMRGYAFDRR